MNPIRTTIADALSAAAARLDPTPPGPLQPFVVTERTKTGWAVRVYGVDGDELTAATVSGDASLAEALVGAGIGLLRKGVRL